LASRTPTQALSGKDGLTWRIGITNGFAYWDSAIMAAARALGCRILFSEDMSHGRQVEGITIINSFR
jgi:predicted nucleic acid-binding protein